MFYNLCSVAVIQVMVVFSSKKNLWEQDWESYYSVKVKKNNRLLILLFLGLMEILPDRCSTIAKKELIYAGTVGLICWLGGIIFINRKKTSDAKNVMAETAKIMLSDQVMEPGTGT